MLTSQIPSKEYTLNFPFSHFKDILVLKYTIGTTHMTAEVIIMNKRGVAIAADSATTRTNQSGKIVKIYTETNKIEVISFSPPIAMVHNNVSTFNEIPWDLVAFGFRKKYPNPWKSLEQCSRLFLNYLASATIDKEACQREYIRLTIKRIYSRYTRLSKRVPLKLDSFIQRDLAKISTSSLFAEMQDDVYDLDDESLKIIDREFEQCESCSDNLFGSLLSKAKNLAYHALKHPCIFNNHMYTEIAITGYGINDYFPSVFRYRIYGTIGNKVVYQPDISRKISIRNKQEILPLAQTGEIQNYLNGINPYIEFNLRRKFESVSSIFKNKMFKLLREYVGTYKKPDCDLKEELEAALENLKNEFFKSHIIFTKSTALEIESTIQLLTLPDMAKLAQNLIDITSYKRHAQQSDPGTVGGETEVAVLSKTDGFVWVKHKIMDDNNCNQANFNRKLK